jgi:hypothetical protein
MTNVDLALKMPDFLKRTNGKVPLVHPIPEREEVKYAMPSKAKKSAPKVVPVAAVEQTTEAKNAITSMQLSGLVEDAIFAILAGTDEISSVVKLVKIGATNRTIASMTLKRVTALVDEIRSIDSDPDVTEAYSFLSEKEVKKLKDIAQEALAVVRVQAEGKNTRRARRVVSPRAEKVSQNVRFQAECPDLGVKSLDPIDVVGATVVLMYDTKGRNLRLFYAKDGEKLSFSGTTLQNFDQDRSSVKTLRKPSEVLPAMIGTLQRRVEVVFGDVTSKARACSGRTGHDTVIVRAFK